MQNNKLGTMPMGKLLFNMSGPIILSMVIQALYNIVDSMFVARYSEVALNAVSLCYPIQMIMVSLSVGGAISVQALLARFLGSKEFDKANSVATHGLLMALFHASLFILFGIFCSKQFLLLFSNDMEIIREGISYMQICTIFGFGIFVQIVYERFMQATGNAIYNMIIQGAGALLNIILDPIFIFIFDMGVQGAAIATVLSQAVGALWILKFLCGKKTILHLKKEYMKIEKDILMPCLALGSSTFVMISTESLLSMTFTSSLARYGGDIAVGAMTIITSVSQLCSMPLQGIVQGGQTIISYNFGAGNNDRVKKAFVCELIVCAVYSCSFFVLMMFLPNVFASIFTSDVALTSYTANVMRIYMAGIFATGFQISCQNTFVGLSQAKISLFLAVLRKLILLIPLILILPVFMSDKVFGVFLAEPVSDILAATVTTITFMTRFNKILAKGPQR